MAVQEGLDNATRVLDSIATSREVDSVVSRAKEISAAWHDGIRQRRRLYDLQHYTTKAKPYEDRFTDPTPVSTVDMAVSVIMSGDLSFSAKGFSPSQSEQDDADRIEKFLHGLLQVNNEREESNLIYDLTLHLVRDGAAVLYTVWDNDIQDSVFTLVPMPAPEQIDPTGVVMVPAFTEPPLRVQVIDPMKIHAIPGGPYRWSHIIREEEMTVADVEALFGVEVAKYGHLSPLQKQQTTGSLIDFWRVIKKFETTPEGIPRGKYVIQNALMYQGTVLKELQDMDGYDDLPFTIAFYKPVDKSESKGWGHGILDPMMGTLEHLEKAVNRRSRQILVYSSMPPVTRLQSDRAINTPNVIGQPIKLGPGEDFAFPVWPGNPPDVEKHIAFLQDRMRMSGFNESFYGTGSEGMSGYAISRLSDVNKLKIEVPIKNLELLFTLWAKKTLKLAVSFASGVVLRVYGRLRGQDFIEQIVGEEFANYIVTSRLRTKYPGDESRKHAMATQIRGLLSDTTIMETYLEVEQPGDERKKRLREMAQVHPIMQQYLMLTALMELAEDGDMAAAMALQSMQGQMMGQGGPPGGAPEPMQAEGGLPSATGELTPQEGGMPTRQEEAMQGPLGGRPPMGEF